MATIPNPPPGTTPGLPTGPRGVVGPDGQTVPRKVRPPAAVATGHEIPAQRGAYSYSTGNPQCCAKCGSLARGVYSGVKLIGPLPHVHARVRAGATTRHMQTSFLVSADFNEVPQVITQEDIRTGIYTAKLGIARVYDRGISDAIGTALEMVAYGPSIPQRDAAPTSDQRTESGNVPLPMVEVMPRGYFVTPADNAGADKGLRSIAEICAKRNKLCLVMGASALSFATGPVGGINAQSHWWVLVGPSTIGKTSTLHAAASLWGDPRLTQVVQSWNATENGPMRRLGNLGIYPAFYDEAGTSGFEPKKWAKIINGTVQGNSKNRAARDAPGEDNTAPWFGVMFTTGNADITDGIDQGPFAGIPVRVITLTGRSSQDGFTGSAEEAEWLKRSAYSSHGIVGPDVMRAFTVDQIEKMIGLAQVDLGDTPGHLAARVSQSVAQAVAGAEAAGWVIGMRLAGEGEAQALAARLRASALEGARDYFANNWTEPESDGEKMRQAVADLFSSSHRLFATADDYRFQSGINNYKGYRDEDYVYLRPPVWKELVRDEGTDGNRALAELAEMGALYTTPGARKGRGATWQGKPPKWTASPARVYKFIRAGLASPDGGQEPGPDNDGQGPAPADTALTLPETAKEMPPGIPAALSGLGALRIVSGAEAATVAGRHSEYLDKARASKWTEEQRSALAERMLMLDAGASKNELRILEALEGKAHEGPGPFAPRAGKRGPYWMPELPPIIWDARPVAGWSFDRPWEGTAAVLDRNAAWVSAAASVVIVHGDFGHHSAGGTIGPGIVAPGYYQVPIYPWDEPGMPAPLDGRPGESAWIPAPLVGLLRELAAAGRWGPGPELEYAQSYTGQAARLGPWAHLVKELRAYALEFYGRESEQYTAVKDAFGMATSLMMGQADPGPVPKRTWSCKAHRPDWRMHIQSQAAVSVWRDGDRLRVAGADTAPIALRAVDEIVIPEAALPAAEKIIRLDRTEIALGTYKVKGTEVRK